ncbi:hypothetical protein [Streptomyces sp. NPDC006638]|uniref:hypothetical protein n=1 Tax=Streptomyces sp. NPDC006638 TaxID=3157183 RepID=UPI0033BA5F6D
MSLRPLLALGARKVLACRVVPASLTVPVAQETFVVLVVRKAPLDMRVLAGPAIPADREAPTYQANYGPLMVPKAQAGPVGRTSVEGTTAPVGLVVRRPLEDLAALVGLVGREARKAPLGTRVSAGTVVPAGRGTLADQVNRGPLVVPAGQELRAALGCRRDRRAPLGTRGLVGAVVPAGRGTLADRMSLGSLVALGDREVLV